MRDPPYTLLSPCLILSWEPFFVEPELKPSKSNLHVTWRTYSGAPFYTHLILLNLHLSFYQNAYSWGHRFGKGASHRLCKSNHHQICAVGRGESARDTMTVWSLYHVKWLFYHIMNQLVWHQRVHDGLWFAKPDMARTTN